MGTNNQMLPTTNMEPPTHKKQMEPPTPTPTQKTRSKISIGLGVLGLLLLLAVGLFAGNDVIISRTRRSNDVIQMTHTDEPQIEIEEPEVIDSKAESMSLLQPEESDSSPPDQPGVVVRHINHAVHTEVHAVNLQDAMRAAAQKAASAHPAPQNINSAYVPPRAAMMNTPEKLKSGKLTFGESQELNESHDGPPTQSGSPNELTYAELPDFDICPIMPELPGESGSIRKVREIERQNVQRRVTEKLGSFNETQMGCTADCHVGCPEGTYRLPGMVECKPRLNCEQIRSLTKDRNLIGGGGVKRIYTADLQGSSVVIARVKRFKFNQYLDSMIELQQTGIVAQLIGMCEEPAWPEVVLQYHSLGSLLTVSQLPDQLPLRWRIIMSYLDIVEKLHNRVPRSPRVLCDASRTEITLSQFLLTDDFRVVLNDVDELIAAGADGKVRCNCNIIRGGSEFSDGEGGCLVPPEQKQCGTNIYYTEKIDIWKIPDITNAILGESDAAKDVWDDLHRLHQECKHANPNMRPPIEYVVDKYKQLQYKLQIPDYQ